MSNIRRIGALVGVAVLSLTAAGTPAHAGTTEIRGAAAPNDLYSGPIKATLIKPLKFHVGNNVIVCTSSTLYGTIWSDGAPLNITSGTIGGCTGFASNIVLQNLPWIGSAVYSPTPAPPDGSGRDGLFILPGFRMAVTVLGLVCAYGTTLNANGFNGDNPHRPVPSNNELQADLTGFSATKLSGGLPCPKNCSAAEGAYQIMGESAFGSGAFTRSLSLTGVHP